MNIAYFINQYPKVSHSFIRREILALERQGVSMRRYALRGWDAHLVDADDLQEQQRTRFVLKGGIVPVVAAMVGFALRRPAAFARGLGTAWELARDGDRTWIYHLVALGEAAALVNWMRADGIDHVHAHFGTNSAEVVMLARALGGPSYSFTVHGSAEWDMPKQYKLREKIRDAAFVVGISSYTKAQLCRWADPEHWPKIHVVHCGLEEAFHGTADMLAPDNQRLVSIGRFVKEKAFGLLVEAVGRLKEQGVRVELVLCGDGELRPSIEALIKQYGIESQVRITGWISSAQVREELLAARAFVLSSVMEALPVVLMEAMALRRPVLATYVGGIPELVRNGREGWLFPAGSLEELMNAIRACLDTPVETLREMAECGRARALERHAVDTEALKLIGLFRSVATAPGRQSQGLSRPSAPCQ
jgi:colanic acid/amylovoran biosynthesis glycosyltransferase